MEKIDWATKLKSRKFWLSIIGFVSGMIIFITGNEQLAEAIGGLIMSAASVIAYIIGEGLSDAAYNKALASKEVMKLIANAQNANVVPDTTGRDGITIDGNEDEE